MGSLIATDNMHAVVGLGKTGWSCARFLRARQIPFFVVDSREQLPELAAFNQEFPDVKCYLGAFNADVLCQAQVLVISPGISLQEAAIVQAINKGSEISSDVELFRLQVNKPIVAITGSNGKTTVTTLLGAMARDAGLNTVVAGNIGLPVLDTLDEHGNELNNVDIYVLELSSFQLERFDALQAEVACILNISADHMDRYASLSDYHLAKQKIYRGAKHIVSNRQDRLTQALAPSSVGQTSFGLNAPDLKDFGVRSEAGKTYLCKGSEYLLDVAELKIAGEHNRANALAALAMGNAAGLLMASMLQTLREFRGLPHRCQWVAEKGRVTYINDSKGTNVGATVAAIKGLAAETQNIVLIAGGVGKDADFTPLRSAMQQHGKIAVLIGEAAGDIEKVLGSVIPVLHSHSLEDAVQLAANEAVAGDVVLLSPACASFDMFSGYEDRGERYMAAVLALGEVA